MVADNRIRKNLLRRTIRQIFIAFIILGCPPVVSAMTVSDFSGYPIDHTPLEEKKSPSKGYDESMANKDSGRAMPTPGGFCTRNRLSRSVIYYESCLYCHSNTAATGSGRRRSSSGYSRTQASPGTSGHTSVKRRNASTAVNATGSSIQQPPAERVTHPRYLQEQANQEYYEKVSPAHARVHSDVAGEKTAVFQGHPSTESQENFRSPQEQAYREYYDKMIDDYSKVYPEPDGNNASYMQQQLAAESEDSLISLQDNARKVYHETITAYWPEESDSGAGDDSISESQEMLQYEQVYRNYWEKVKAFWASVYPSLFGDNFDPTLFIDYDEIRDKIQYLQAKQEYDEMVQSFWSGIYPGLFEDDTDSDEWEAVTTTAMYLSTEITLGEVLTFEYMWATGCGYDTLVPAVLYYGDTNFDPLLSGYLICPDSPSLEWETYLIYVPESLIGTTVQFYFMLRDSCWSTDPLVYIRNICSTVTTGATPTPEPMTFLLLGAGLLAMSAVCRKRDNS